MDIKNYLMDYIEELSFDLKKQNVHVDFQYDPNRLLPCPSRSGEIQACSSEYYQ